MSRLELYQVRQPVYRERIPALSQALYDELEQKGAHRRVKSGWKVAITVGSRGIDALPELLCSLVRWLKERETYPFLVPAMGSHGGGTAEGQKRLLRENGVTEERIGAPIAASMEVERLGSTPAGAPVYIDKEALSADAVIVLNRIKPHTTMGGPVQSGLLKMLAVGLGNRSGAASMHRFGLEENVPPAAKLVLQKARVAFGIGLLENAYKEPCKIAVISPEEMAQEEKKLLGRALEILPVVPFDPLDVLIVRKMGKNISGSGMDTNVVGRWRRVGGRVDRHIACLVVLGLTPQSRGNAYGVGMADFIPGELYRCIDFKSTYTNALTARWIGGAKMPVVLEREEDIIRQLLQWYPPRKVALAVIESTLNLETFWVSPALLKRSETSSSIRVMKGPAEVGFDVHGRIALYAKREKGPFRFTQGDGAEG